jgi:hypothetical protein
VGRLGCSARSNLHEIQVTSRTTNQPVPASAGWYVRRSIALHEFAHAASECQTGRVIDAYVEGGDFPNTIVNKKYRKRKRQRVPKRFGTYDAGDKRPQEYPSDPDRDGLGYPDDWTSCHPAPLEPLSEHLLARRAHRDWWAYSQR